MAQRRPSWRTLHGVMWLSSPGEQFQGDAAMGFDMFGHVYSAHAAAANQLSSRYC